MLREVKLKEDEASPRSSILSSECTIYGALGTVAEPTGIPQRIWLVIGTCVGLFTLSRIVFGKCFGFILRAPLIMF
jgi:hypothetical protein